MPCGLPPRGSCPKSPAHERCGRIFDITHPEVNWLSDLQDTLIKEGAFKVGFGDLTALPETQRKGLPRGISIAVPLDLAVINRLGVGMTSEYHAEYNRSNALLKRLALLAADLLRKEGYAAVAMVGGQVEESYQEHATVLPHKTVATRAGMGDIIIFIFLDMLIASLTDRYHTYLMYHIILV